MGVYKKDNRWYIDYYLPDGKRKRETVTIPDVDPSKITREDAKKAESIRKAQIAEGKFEITQTKKPFLFDTFVERYINEYSKVNKRAWKRDEASGKALLKFFSGKTLTQITSWLVEKYKAQRQNEKSRFGTPVARTTINRELSCLKTMFNKAIEWGLVSSNPAKKVKLFPEKPNKVRVLSDDEFQKLYDASTDFLKPILIIAINSGMRRKEVVTLKREDVNFKQEFVTVRESKNNDSRIIPMNEVSKKTFELAVNTVHGEYLFGDRIDYLLNRVENNFAQAFKKSGIAKCSFHDLRHTFATRLVMAGVDIVTVQELLGHKNINMTKRYSHPTPMHKKQAVSMLNIGSMDTHLDTREGYEEGKNVVSLLND
ncbi:MAG TPA: tyrosine-type recombinase/integrase [Thermodesulfobacteriota bacterium]|nr:tyrosine-type recombinase/integrase [Thermodesulfobacteriota bacterium]